MSFNVFVISEDMRHDQYTLKPIVQKLLAVCGKDKAKVICDREIMGGVTEALDSNRIRDVVDRYRMVDLFLLCVDRDGVAGRQQRLDRIEVEFSAIVGQNRRFFAVNAWQEIEVWILAGHDLLQGWDWQEIRNEIHPKERFFIPFSESLQKSELPHGGRKQLAEMACEKYDRMRQRCPEDLAVLESRVRSWIEESAISS